jgi:hypothetical protein
MSAFRYKTAAVYGRWRDTRREAMRDAVRDGFARWQDRSWRALIWRLPGEIEEGERADGE